MKILNKKTLILFSLLTLSACGGSSNIEEEWQCPIDQGKGCQTIKQADTSSTEGKSFAGLGATSNAKDTPARSREIIGKISFYPFIDSQGNYHKGNTVFKVFKPSDWK